MIPGGLGWPLRFTLLFSRPEGGETKYQGKKWLPEKRGNDIMGTKASFCTQGVSLVLEAAAFCCAKVPLNSNWINIIVMFWNFIERHDTVMERKHFLLLLAGVFFLLSACKSQEPPATEPEAGKQSVALTVWGAEEDQALLQEILDSFQKQYAGQAEFQFTLQAQSESNCKDGVLGDLEGGPDVFAFADDQVAALAAAGALDPIADPEAIRQANLPAAVEAASVDGTLYAYPLTADNGYFLYYNKAYFSEEDIQSLNRMVDVAAKAGGKVAMDWSSAWYVYAFFGNTGLEVGLNPDGITNFCTWNSAENSIPGTEVAQAMLDIAASPGFSNRTDTDFLAGVQDGSVIAGVSGVWNAVAVEEAWG